ncbi:MAG: nitrilase, partial [Desulfurococcales archaeon]|nr:nitrilase [Desulfurococcales archaeon]
IALSVQYSSNFTGRSMVIDPLGVVLADLGIGEKYAEVPIDLDYIGEARKTLPVLKLRREDIYDLRWTT